MASSVLYPPLVKSYENAFVVNGDPEKDELIIHLAYSVFASSKVPDYAHINITRKDGVKVLKTQDDFNFDEKPTYRARITGTILNAPIYYNSNDENYPYYVIIKGKDLKSQVDFKLEDNSNKTYRGFIPGWIYKIQIRFSEVSYNPTTTEMGQLEWLQQNSSKFSEWSSICYAKAIAPMRLQIPLFNNFDSLSNNSKRNGFRLKNIDFFGNITSSLVEVNEIYSTIRIKLFRNDNNALLEDSGDLYKTELSDSYFSYKFKTNFKEDINYKIIFTYVTENDYHSEAYEFTFNYIERLADRVNAYAITCEGSENNEILKSTSIELEEDEGRIGIKICSNNNNPYSGNICLVRSCSDDNFSTWEDIKTLVFKEEIINDSPLIYDYTIESGKWYKYGVQSISNLGERGIIRPMATPVRRIFNYSYLLGQGGRQLKLQFDNTISSFKIQTLESKLETIGSKYPYISRNALVNYKTFPITGLISFWMDENNTFLTNGKKDIYGKDSIVKEYENDNSERNILQYDYTYERDFRQEVLSFLMDGKPKLFKSPSEGNIIIRLMDINCTPKMNDRLIYSFSANANEIDDSTMSNYLKYGYYNPGSYTTEFETTTTHLGQLSGEFEFKNGHTNNIIELIKDKYTFKGKNIGGYVKNLVEIKHLKITINSPLFYYNEDELGHKFQYNNNTYYISNKIYEFNSLINLNLQDKLYLLKPLNETVEKINVTFDFVYTITSKPYKEKEILAQETVEGIGQIFQKIKPGTSLYNLIFHKYYLDTQKNFRKLNTIQNIVIEAPPHTVFRILDESDKNNDTNVNHEIGSTGMLALYDLGEIKNLVYVGRKYINNYNEGSLTALSKNAEDTADVRVTYYYTAKEGIYVTNENENNLTPEEQEEA